AVLLENLAGKNHGDRLGDAVRGEHFGRREMHAQRVLVRRLHALDLAEVERLHAFLGVLLEAVLDVRRDELSSVERRDVLPLDALTELEGPDARVGTRLPGLREIRLQRKIAGSAHLLGEGVADQAARDEAGELEETDRLRQSRIDQGR